jgi:hypothetical protein
MRIKSSADIDKAYKAAISGVPAAYKDGVSGVTGWKGAAIAGQDLYEAQMRDAKVLARREKGLAAVSDEDWKKAAVEKGAARIGAGMTAGADKRAKNYEPYRAEIAAMTLEAKTADPATNVDRRVKPIAVRLHEKKMSG